MAWAQAARYLDGRIQATAEHKPGRAPDLSAEAAAATELAMVAEPMAAMARELRRYVHQTKELHRARSRAEHSETLRGRALLVGA